MCLRKGLFFPIIFLEKGPDIGTKRHDNHDRSLSIGHAKSDENADGDGGPNRRSRLLAPITPPISARSPRSTNLSAIIGFSLMLLNAYGLGDQITPRPR